MVTTDGLVMGTTGWCNSFTTRLTRSDWRRQTVTAAEVARHARQPVDSVWAAEPAICTDGVHVMCHDLERLHRFAAAVGLNPRSFTDHARHPHYDLMTRELRQRALDAGAVPLSTRDLLRRFRRSS